MIGGAPPRRGTSRLQNIPEGDRSELIRDLDLSFMSIDQAGNIKEKIAQAAIVAAQTYLITTQPSPDDPRVALHRSSLMNLGMVGASLAQA